MEKYINQLRPYAPVLILLSFVAVVLAAVGTYSGSDVWLNSMTWLIVASVLGIWAVYLKK